MKYVYNEERDRISCKAWNPHFFLITYKETATGEERAAMLHTVTNLQRHVRGIAEKYANSGETLKEILKIPRKQYEAWLCGSDTVTLQGVQIPASYIVDFLIAEDWPQSKNKEGEVVRHGDLSRTKELLTEKDPYLCQKILESYEKASTKNDIVREVADVTQDALYETYNKERGLD